MVRRGIIDNIRTFWAFATVRPQQPSDAEGSDRKRARHLMQTLNENLFEASDDNGGNIASYDDTTMPWIDVARVANLAEAGFIVDELIGLGFQARVHQLDEFSAATDRWSAKYLIRAPDEYAAAAAVHIGQYLSEEPIGQRTMLERLRESVGNMPQDRTASRKYVLIVTLVGVTSFLFGHEYSEPAAPRQNRSSDLTTAIKSVGVTLSSEPAANRPNYQLSFDPQHQLWTLSADRDHDGIYESEQHFTASGMAR